MPCCCNHARGADRLFSLFARRYRKRYQKKGLEKSQKHLIEGLKKAGIAGTSVLEIGSGVGYLHQLLLQAGAARAVGVDLSEKMLTEAHILARENGLSGRVEYHHGDFVDLADTIADADVTILDKVVCCYPDAEALVKRSLAKTRRVYALTYPRDRAFIRFGMTLFAFFLWLICSPFRSYVHDPEKIESWIQAEGFKKHCQNETPIWLTQVYVHSDVSGRGRKHGSG